MTALTEWVVGLDLATASDFTAICIIQRAGEELHVRHLERQRGTSYVAQADHVAHMLNRPPLVGDATLAVDATGVGAPVVDMLSERLGKRAPLVAITINSGRNANRDGRKWSVPKRDLINAAQLEMQNKTLAIPASLPNGELLHGELSSYTVSISEDGHDTYANNARENPNDDLVLALCLGVYTARQTAKRRGPRMVFMGNRVLVERQLAANVALGDLMNPHLRKDVKTLREEFGENRPAYVNALDGVNVNLSAPPDEPRSGEQSDPRTNEVVTAAVLRLNTKGWNSK